MRLIKRAEIEFKGNMPANRAWFTQQWSYTMQHYSMVACDAKCPCPYAGKTIADKKADGKFFLDPSDDKGKKIIVS